MQLSQQDLVLSSREMQVRWSAERKSSLVRISRGAYLKINPAWLVSEPWRRRRIIAEARIIATGSTLGEFDQPVFTGESALIALGLNTWWNNPDVTYRRKTTAGGRPVFNQVQFGTQVVAPVKTQQLRSKPSVGAQGAGLVHGVFVAPYEVISADLARQLHPLQAFYDLSTLVRYLSGFDRFDQLRGRLNEAEIKVGFALYLESLGGTEGVAQARRLVEVIDAGIESPGEAIVVWALRCILRENELLVTQQRESAEGGSFYIDVALPAYKLGFEITGMNKFGDTRESAGRVAMTFVQRQQQLADSGWTIVNITYAQTLRFRDLVNYLLKTLSRIGVSVCQPKAPIWAQPSSSLNARSRRF